MKNKSGLLRRITFMLLFIITSGPCIACLFIGIILGLPLAIILWLFSGKFYFDELTFDWWYILIELPYKVTGIEL